MTVHLVTFATDDMSRAKDLCIHSALSHGVEQAFWFGFHFSKFIFPELQLDLRIRGAGHWKWKPAIIQKTMQRMNNGDILIYSDVGVEFINNVSHIIDRMDQDIFLFGNQWPHYAWCKADIVEYVWPAIVHPYDDADANYHRWNRFDRQCQASVIFFRVSDYSRKFVKEWLDWCLFEGGRLIDDSPSRTPNHPEFQENRHDQAILTTLAYREGIKLHHWAAVYGEGRHLYPNNFADEGIPPMFFHHRRRNHEFSEAA